MKHYLSSAAVAIAAAMSMHSALAAQYETRVMVVFTQEAETAYNEGNVVQALEDSIDIVFADLDTGQDYVDFTIVNNELGGKYPVVDIAEISFGRDPTLIADVAAHVDPNAATIQPHPQPKVTVVGEGVTLEQLRYMWKADVVIVVGKNLISPGSVPGSKHANPQWTGIGGGKDLAYIAVDGGNATLDETLGAHEMGHVHGGGHQDETAPARAATACVAHPGTSRATVMAQPGWCLVFPRADPELFFSKEGRVYLGLPLGSSTRDNWTVVRGFVPSVAGYFESLSPPVPLVSIATSIGNREFFGCLFTSPKYLIEFSNTNGALGEWNVQRLLGGSWVNQSHSVSSNFTFATCGNGPLTLPSAQQVRFRARIETPNPNTTEPWRYLTFWTVNCRRGGGPPIPFATEPPQPPGGG